MYKVLQILFFLFLALHLPVFNFAQSKEEILLREISSSKTQNSKIDKLIELHNYYSTTKRTTTTKKTTKVRFKKKIG